LTNENVHCRELPERGRVQILMGESGRGMLRKSMCRLDLTLINDLNIELLTWKLNM
jgi:hypothetical protein